MSLLEQLQSALAATYAIERQIGAGGMATVYLARDLKHDRQVAVKVLNPELGAVLGVERFLSEIRVTANLQHPNLLPLFDSGDAGGHLFYVMPFVEGESLRTRLDRERQLPVDEAVRIATGIGNALAYAHQHGVIHRDLKPENILLQHGQPVIADFGIALAISKAGGSRVTQTGLSLGTPQYMSPEQAAGDRVLDGRSDIYSLGAMTYEMLAGEPPHVGQSVQAIVAKVLTDKPRSLRLARETVPVVVEMAVDKALAKLPADRFATAEEFVRALAGDRTGLVPSVTAAGEARTTRAWLRHPASWVSVVVAAGAVAMLATTAGRTARVDDERTVAFSFTTKVGGAVRPVLGALIGISPDGKTVAYVGESARGSQIWVRAMDDLSGRALESTYDPNLPVFSPDGKTVFYYDNTRRKCMRIGVEGGMPTVVFECDVATPLAFYGADSVIYYSGGQTIGQAGHLWRTTQHGARGEKFLRNDSTAVSTDQWSPYIAPDKQTVFFVSAVNASNYFGKLGYTTLDDRTIHLTDVSCAAVLGYAAGRVIIVAEDGAIMAVGFDLSRHTLIGTPIPTGERTRIDGFGPKAALSVRGDLVFVTGNTSTQVVMATGGSAFTPLLADPREYGAPRYSPDGQRIAMSIANGQDEDIWIYQRASGSLERLTSDGRSSRPEWTPDGKKVLYRSTKDGLYAIYWQNVDGSDKPERLTPTISEPAQEAVVTPDGQTLVYRVDTPNRARDIYTMPLDGTRKPKEWLVTPADELNMRVSPDGKWMVYVSTESGRDEVYVRPFPGPGGRTLVSLNGGGEPLWSRDGKRVFYRETDVVISAELRLGPAPQIVKRDTVVTGDFASLRFHPYYDVMPEGNKLLMLSPVGRGILPTMILNWGASLQRRLGPVR